MGSHAALVAGEGGGGFLEVGQIWVKHGERQATRSAKKVHGTCNKGPSSAMLSFQGKHCLTGADNK